MFWGHCSCDSMVGRLIPVMVKHGGQVLVTSVEDHELNSQQDKSKTFNTVFTEFEGVSTNTGWFRVNV